MIQLFEIKKKVKQMKNTDKELLEKYTEISTRKDGKFRCKISTSQSFL